MLERFLFGTSVFFVLFLGACDNHKHKPVFNSRSDAISEDTTSYVGEVVTIPFKEDSASLKIVCVKVNDTPMDMIFDTGCSITQLSLLEAQKLLASGGLTESDIKGDINFQLADGSTVENVIVNLKSVVIDDQLEFHNVEATISKSVNSSLLLGNDLLNQVASYEIDNERKEVNFKLKKPISEL